jgi:hypothetical protein
VEKSDPGMFEEIGTRIAERRWWLVGGYLEWEEPEG